MEVLIILAILLVVGVYLATSLNKKDKSVSTSHDDEASSSADPRVSDIVETSTVVSSPTTQADVVVKAAPELNLTGVEIKVTTADQTVDPIVVTTTPVQPTLDPMVIVPSVKVAEVKPKTPRKQRQAKAKSAAKKAKTSK